MSSAARAHKCPTQFVQHKYSRTPVAAENMTLTSWSSFGVWQQVQQGEGALPCCWPSWMHWRSLIPIWTALSTDKTMILLTPIVFSKKSTRDHQSPVVDGLEASDHWNKMSTHTHTKFYEQWGRCFTNFNYCCYYYYYCTAVRHVLISQILNLKTSTCLHKLKVPHSWNPIIFTGMLNTNASKKSFTTQTLTLEVKK